MKNGRVSNIDSIANAAKCIDTEQEMSNQTFCLTSFSKLNTPNDMLFEHVSNTPVITDITLNSSHCYISPFYSIIRSK